MMNLPAILNLLAEKGGVRYGEERITQLQHALQCAALAERANAPDALVTAALLHDIGHLIVDDEGAAARGDDLRHEQSGADTLAALFGSSVTEPIRLHVDAKRYLCARNPRYFDSLSPASIVSLEVQGGVFSPTEAEAFASRPHARAATSLRCWDDLAKDSAALTPPLSHFLAPAERALR